LFHKPTLPSSTRVLNLLKNASASAAEARTQEQDRKRSERARDEFQLDITEAPPTSDQLHNILDYVAPAGVKPEAVVFGAGDRTDALRKLKESNGDLFVRPVVRFSRGFISFSFPLLLSCLATFTADTR
jgi:Protein of unknown function (DUF1687)